MDSTALRFAARVFAALAVTAGAAMPAAALNHDTVVAPLSPGPFTVACSNTAQDPSRVAPGATPSDYWEGRPVNGVDHYITEILANPQAAVRFDAPVPDDSRLYPDHAGATVTFVAIVCHPTPRSNTDPDYVLPETGDVIPHMQPAGTAPKLISENEYLAGFGMPAPLTPAADLPARMPLIEYSHGLGGSPIGSGYVQVMVQLAAQGFMVAGVFHGDPRFSRIQVSGLSDVAYVFRDFDHVVEMQLMRPLSLKVMTDTLLADPGFSPGIDTDRIGGFGASLGGEAMALLVGAKLTTQLGFGCDDPVRDPRIRAAVGYVPYGGQSFLPAFCHGQDGAAGVYRPYLAISGTADTTAPIDVMQRAVERFGSSRYLVQLVDGQHELRPQDAGDVLTWTVTFLNAYFDLPRRGPGMAEFIRMNSVASVDGRENNMRLDIHVPFPDSGSQVAVREFYNTQLDHYFVAAGSDEIAGILAGAAGPGWQLTGLSFKAWLDGAADGYPAVPVCRFYGGLNGGPNSHFFTASASECDLVKASGGWFYEGTGFYIRPVDADGTCPGGYLAVSRAYNNGFARNDSNHRFSTSDSMMREMQARGWTVEGNVMCALP